MCIRDRVDTVYIGGGTPTCLGAGYLSEILQAVGACFAIAENAEITVECNPESTDQAVPVSYTHLHSSRASAACADSISSVIFIYGSSIPLSAALSFSLARWMSLRTFGSVVSRIFAISALERCV